MSIRNAVAAALVIAAGIILICHMRLILLHGGVFIYEDNNSLLIAEIVMASCMIVFGVERFIAAVRVKRVD